ncbi:PAX-interacting protein 1 isoform X2 [Salvia hispanica]|uniref:PAX-interacting protein 1 isoform X2 n=1 Tax=Salvia hispanica TaxID=49212 RepID=UPI002009D392|nr:PAX-interacting protein 1 isoform X2 [Salvia hispanica]
MKVDLLSKGYSAKRKRLSLSPLSRSPLMKELTRLGYPDSMPDFLPKDSRRRRATEKVCVLFSQNLDTSKLKQQKKIVTRLGFSIASCSSDATHFVADRFVRTRNMLEATSLGKHVVTHLRLESCEQAGYNVDEKSYILRDEKKEKEFGFNMHVTLMRGSKHPLLKVVQSILKAKKDQLIHNDVLILSFVEDYTICLQYLHKGASIYDSELLLNGIVTQELQYERLFKDRKKNGH